MVPTVLKIADEDFVYWMHMRKSVWREIVDHTKHADAPGNPCTQPVGSAYYSVQMHTPHECCHLLHLGRDVGSSIRWLTEAAARRGDILSATDLNVVM